MLRRLPANRGSIVALFALCLVAFAAHGPQRVWGIESSLHTVEIGVRSTLDAEVESQDFAQQAKEFDLFYGGPIASIVQPVEGPLLRPVAKPIRTARKTPKTKKESPFIQWISPKVVSDRVKVEQAEPRVARRVEPRQSAPEPQTLDRRITKAPEPPKTRTKKLTTRSKKPSTPGLTFPINPPQSTRTDLPRLTKSQQQLRAKIRRVLSYYYSRPLNTRDRGPWEMMHTMLAFEVNSRILQGGPKGKPVTTVGWLCFNQACRKRTLMYVNDDGNLQVRTGPALQGHRGQLLSILAQAKVKRDYPMRIEDHDFTVNDLIKMEMRSCYPRTELTFKLIGISHYLDSDARWMNDQGMQWDIPKMISEEIRQPVRGAACGGTHRLSGLTLAYKNRLKRGEPVDGEYLKAQKFVAQYQRYAYKLQNRDGSLSTEWFRGPGNKEDIDRKLLTTGHLLEWLLYAASEKELRHSKTARAANYLASTMYNNRNKDWEQGPLGHALHALLVYDRLVFGPYEQRNPLPVAGKRAANEKR